MNRIETLQTLMKENQISLVAVSAGPDLFYLTGLEFHISERPAILLVADSGKPHLIHPELEMIKVKECKYPIISFPYSEVKDTWANICAQALADLPGDKKKIGVISTQMRFLEMELLHRANSEFRFISVDALFQKMRTCKEIGEISSIRKAVEIAERAFLETIRSIEPGRTEKEVASILVTNLFECGSDPELPFSPIIASGPNSANPHATPTEREIEIGDLIVIDWGAACNHYISDLTRTISMGKPTDEFAKIAQIVKEANTAGREFAKAQVFCNEVDATTRTVIYMAGYGEYFTHRTGHGIGMEAHEAPYISSDYHHPLEVGNTFTIEPGIYLPRRGGVRIEDNVVITEEGAETLSTLSRDLFIIE